MKILVVGSDKVFAIEVLYVKYLRQLGVDVQHFAGQSTFYDFYQKNIFNKLLFRSGLSNIYTRINNAFREVVLKFQPDVILVFKGMEITASSIKWAKSLGCKLVNYNPDNPLLFSGKGSGNKNVADSISLFDLYLSYDWEVIGTIKVKYAINADLLPFGYDVDESMVELVKQQQEVNKVCFLGNPDKERAQFIKQLAEAGIDIDVYGNDWDRFLQHSNIKSYPAVYKADYWKALYKYRVQLNLMRPHNPRSHNMRTFELGGIGGIQLALDTIDHRNYFSPGNEIFLYSNLDECIERISHIKALDVTSANKIRENARNRSVMSKYSYADRAEEVVHVMKKYFPNLNEPTVKEK